MKLHIFKLLLMCMLIASTSASNAHTRNCEPAPHRAVPQTLLDELSTEKIPYPRINVKDIFRVFIQAVENGELIIFDRLLDSTEVSPEYVEYIYMPDDLLPTVRIYSSIIVSIPLPTMPEIEIQGVSAIMDQQGRITETIVHCGN
jgi:hypothetical protein